MVAFIAANLVTALGPTIDSIFVGSYYQVDDVAAIGLTHFLLVGYRTLAASIITRGAHVIVSRKIGAGNKEDANKYFSLSIMMCFFVSVAIALFSIIFSNNIAALLGARGSMAYLMKPTSDYLIGYCLGLPFFTLANILTPFLQMDGDYDLVTAHSVVLTVVDIAADYYVVKVMHGGLLMIGLATSLSHFAAFLVTLSHFFLRKSIFRFSLKGVKLSQGVEILETGAPTGVVKLSNTVSGILINNMLAVYVASDAIAALSAGNQIMKFCFSLWLGAASTLLSFSSMFFGEEDKKALESVQKIAIRKGFQCTLPAAAAIFVFAGPLTGLFLRNGDAATLAMGAESIRFFALSMPFNVLIYSSQFYFISAGRRPFANLYSFILEFAIPVPLTFLLLNTIGYRGAWVTKPVANLLAVLVAVVYFQLQRGDTFREKMLLVPENFGAEPGRELIFRGDSMTDVMGISGIAIPFALENGANEKQARMLSLAVEELAGNIVEHGFADGKPHHVDLRMLAKDDGLILRLRDDCKRFDPVEKYRTDLQFSKDPEHGVAIRVMIKLARDIKYTGQYGMNNLIIRI